MPLSRQSTGSLGCFYFSIAINNLGKQIGIGGECVVQVFGRKFRYDPRGRQKFSDQQQSETSRERKREREEEMKKKQIV